MVGGNKLERMRGPRLFFKMLRELELVYDRYAPAAYPTRSIRRTWIDFEVPFEESISMRRPGDNWSRICSTGTRERIAYSKVRHP